MLLIGLTGSIATGKSTVSDALRMAPQSLPVIDADLLARKVVQPGTNGYSRIVDYFGPSTPDLLEPASGTMPAEGLGGRGRPLNRSALGQRVFGDSDENKQARAVLNDIVHPAVRKEMFRQVLWAYLRGYWAVILDIPLLFESHLDVFCGTIIVVAVRDRETQLRRLMDRDTYLSRQDAEDRVQSQADVRLKAERCLMRGDDRGIVLWNDDSKEQLRDQVEKSIVRLRKTRPDWWSWLLLAFPPLAFAAGAVGYWRNIQINKRWSQSAKGIKGKL